MIQKPKGTYDLYGNEAERFIYIENIIREMMNNYNYNYIRTPLFENSELFHRTVGETSDIVSKETYDFIDRGNRNMTLRPEGTAPIVRSYIENKMFANIIQPVKLFYIAPMYRYERPQAERFREHYQFGIEVFGTNDPLLDAEVISIPVYLFTKLGLKGIKVNINTLGDKESRDNYREALLSYFKPHLKDLCDDCNNRYIKNPLRILDCKVDANKEEIKNSPKIKDYLNQGSIDYYNKVKGCLEMLNIQYIENSRLVRGLDYYNHTIFEVEADIEGFGSQNVLCGGGRYNNLVELLEGPSTPGIGFGLGIERLLSALTAENIELDINNELDVFALFLSDSEKTDALILVNQLRNLGYKADLDYMNRNLKGQFKLADRLNTKYIIIIGEEEVKSNIFTVKNNKTKESFKIEKNGLFNFLADNINN